jgi:hypothetical protein
MVGEVEAERSLLVWLAGGLGRGVDARVWAAGVGECSHERQQAMCGRRAVCWMQSQFRVQACWRVCVRQQKISIGTLEDVALRSVCVLRYCSQIVCQEDTHQYHRQV